MLKFFKRISLIVNFETLVVMALAVLSTFLCGKIGFTADLPLTLVTIAVVFPIIFRSAAHTSGASRCSTITA